MLVQHLGATVDIDPVDAAMQNSIIKALRKCGPMRQKNLYYRSAGQKTGRDVFQRAVDALCEKRLIVRETTNRVNSFKIRLANDKRRRERTEKLLVRLRNKSLQSATRHTYNRDGGRAHLAHRPLERGVQRQPRP